MQSPSQILNKLSHFLMENIIMNILMRKILKKKIFNNEDIFGRGIKLKKIHIDKTYPEYIIQNKNKYSNWII